jgi:hypothetical protein
MEHVQKVTMLSIQCCALPLCLDWVSQLPSLCNMEFSVPECLPELKGTLAEGAPVILSLVRW